MTDGQTKHEAQVIEQLLKLLDLGMLGQVAFGAEAVEGAAELAASGRAWKSPFFKGMSSSAWRRMYRRNRRIIATLEHVFAPMGWPSSAARSRWLLMRWAMQWLARTKDQRPPDDKTFRGAPRDVRAGIRLLCRAFRLEISVYNDVLKMPHSDRRSAALALLDEQWELDPMQVPAVLFVMFIAMRCWSETGKLPAFLLREARRGNEDALEFLLRIDPHIHGDPCVAQHLTAARVEAPALFRRLTRAMQSSTAPDARATRANLGGLVKSLSATGKLTEPIIRSAFDGVADLTTDGKTEHDFSLKSHLVRRTCV